jgi:glyoxylase-like metal-dependent hydrolase (beta-lactamase superfamily II)
LRERVSDDIYVFTSDLYAQVTAGLIVTKEGGILIDTLPFPSESAELASFASTVCPGGVRYIVLTHYHADHTYGSYLFPEADIVAHARCRALLAEVGAPALQAAQDEEPELLDVTLRSPDITFKEGELGLQLGGIVTRLIHAPGHSADVVMVYVENDRVLFAADTIMPVPAIADGDVDTLRATLARIDELSVENLVQGHGEVILRGEVSDAVQISLKYLDEIEELVSRAIDSGEGVEILYESSIEDFGLSRIPLNGLVQDIHVANLLALYDLETARGRRKRAVS